jgi:hypothetical protein
MRCVNIRASAVPDSAITTVILDLGVPDLWEDEVIASRNRIKKAESKTPHFLSLNQDIVASPQDEKCGLKYFIHNPGAQSGLQMSRFH